VAGRDIVRHRAREKGIPKERERQRIARENRGKSQRKDIGLTERVQEGSQLSGTEKERL
jgi:hypothetical protein